MGEKKMNFEEAHRKMRRIAEKHFPTYTLTTLYHCDDDYTIEAVHVPEKEYAHKFIYREMTSEPAYKDLDIQDDTVVEAMEHPVPGGGLGQKTCENCEEGNGWYAVAGKIDNL